MADEDVKTDAVTEDKPASPFLADGDSKVGETAAEHDEHPDPAQPAVQPVPERYEGEPSKDWHVPSDDDSSPNPSPRLEPALQEADDAPVAVGASQHDYDGASAMDGHAEAATYGERENPVVTEGTTEVSNEPAVGYQFADPNDPIRARYAEMERKKDEDIAELVKMGDGKPKV